MNNITENAPHATLQDAADHAARMIEGKGYEVSAGSWTEEEGKVCRRARGYYCSVEHSGPRTFMHPCYEVHFEKRDGEWLFFVRNQIADRIPAA